MGKHYEKEFKVMIVDIPTTEGMAWGESNRAKLAGMVECCERGFIFLFSFI